MTVASRNSIKKNDSESGIYISIKQWLKAEKWQEKTNHTCNICTTEANNKHKTSQQKYLLTLPFCCLFPLNMTGRGSRQTEQSSLRVYRTKSLRKPKKIKYTEGTTSNWCFCRPRRSHDGVTQPWKQTRSLMRMLRMGKQLPVGRRPRSRPGS